MNDKNGTNKPGSERQKIPWGNDGFIEFDLPPGWNLLGSMNPASFPGVRSVEAELENSLLNPIGAQPLSSIAGGKKRIVIVVDDISRPTPAHLLMGKILEHLSDAGIDLGSVTVIPGLGLHRAMTREEMERKVGKQNLEKVKWENHDCRDRGRLEYLGKTRRGTAAYINKTVAEADLVILVGTIEPHPHAGFGGGFKNILPGVAGIKTIAQNHAICAHPKYFSMIGADPEKNPMRQDIEEVGRMLGADTFMVNTVLNAKEEITRIVAGDPVASHREGIKTAAQLFGMKIPRQADIVITDSFPMDIDLRQGVKAVANVLFAAKPGGIIIAAMKCDEGLGNFRAPKFRLPISDDAAKFIARLLGAIITKIAPPGISAEERFAAYFLLRAVLRNKIYIYSPSLFDAISWKIPLVRIFGNFRDAINAAQKIKPRGDVLIFPHGAVTYPILR